MEIPKMTLKKARHLADLTQKEAAKQIGVSEVTLSNWERGKFFPNAKMIDKIEKAYGIPKGMISFIGEE